MSSLIHHHTRRELRKLVKGKVLLQVPLSRYTSLRVGGPAEILVYPTDMTELQNIIHFSRTHAIPYFIIGRGTNLLIRDGGIEGLVIKLSYGFKKIKIVELLGEQVKVFVDAGVSLHRFLNFSLAKSLSGAEFLTGIPGSMGGALSMNAGTQGMAMRDITDSITWITPTAEVVEESGDRLPFNYRTLHLPSGTVIVNTQVILKRESQKKILSEIEKRKVWRRHHQPLELPSAGSVFKNPPEKPAGQLVEHAGLKGYQVGGAQISVIHANFIVNRGGATARDILALMETMQHRVYQKTKIWLEPEIKIVGKNGTPCY